MKVTDQLSQSLAEIWHHQFEVLRGAIDQSLEGLQGLLQLDDHQRHGHDEPHLQEALGPFGSQSLDLSALSEVLDKSSSYRRLDDERLERVRALIDRLQALRQSFAEVPAELPGADLDEPVAEISKKLGAHLKEMAGLFRDLRVAALEVRGKNTPELSGESLEAFHWHDLSPEELRLCPPFVVRGQLEPGGGKALRRVMALLESRWPLKIVVLRSSLVKTFPPGADLGVPASLAVEMIPLAMRGVSFLQTCGAVDDFSERLFEALTAPHPALISLLAEKPDEEEAAYLERALGAVRSRTFPMVAYDPDQDSGFVSGLDLSSNPAPEGTTPSFVDFATSQDEFASCFQDVPDGTAPADLVPVTEYLKLSYHQRVGKLPMVRIKGSDGEEEPRVAAPQLVSQVADQQHLWKTLQEISGEDNPYVSATRSVLQAELSSQEKSLRERLTAEFEEQGARRERFAVANAVRALSAQLTGGDPSAVDLEALVQVASR